MHIVFKLMIVGGALSVAGCATAIRGTAGEVDFTSEPSGARVETSTGVACTTPCTITIDRKQPFTASFDLNGQRRTVEVRSELSTGAVALSVVGNALVGGLIGAATDGGSGATMKHTPNPVHADFGVAPTGPAPSEPLLSAQAAVTYAPVPGSPPLTEGSAYAAFTPTQLQAYCGQDWETRTGPDGRTEYNPCHMREAFE